MGRSLTVVTASATDFVHHPSPIVNGSTQVWQLGGGTATYSGSAGGRTNRLNCDCWVADPGSLGKMVISRGEFSKSETAVSRGLPYYLRTVIKTGAAGAELQNRMENWRQFANRTVYCSFDADAHVTLTCSVGIRLWPDESSENGATFYGTQVILNPGMSRYDVTVTVNSVSASATTDPAASMGQFVIQFPDVSGDKLSATCDVTGADVYFDTAARSYYMPSFNDELNSSKRYYQKSSNYGESQTSSLAGVIWSERGPGATGKTRGWNVRFSPEMRVLPTITTYHISLGGVSSWDNQDGGGDIATSVTEITRAGFHLAFAAIAADSDVYAVHYQADARL